MIRLLVFDMAGTTVDEDNVVYKTLRNAINDEGIPVSLQGVLTAGAGREKRQAIKNILKEYAATVDEQVVDRIYDRFMLQLKDAYETLEVKPQPHAADCFNALRRANILVALNTGYNRDTAISLLEKLGWQQGREYDVLITASDVNNNRPHPDMILLAMDKLEVADAKQVVKVGDSIIDIEEGRNAGCLFSIGVTTGAHTRAQLLSARPDHIIDNLQQLPALVGQ